MSTNDSIKSIKGIDISKDVSLLWNVKNNENTVADIEIKIPDGCKHTLTNGIDLSDSDQYEYRADTFKPFGCLNLCRYFSGKLDFEDDMKLPDQHTDFGSYFGIRIEIIKTTDEFDNVFRLDVFEGAVERDIYNNWGAGKYEFDYDSGINWHYEIINGVRWLSFLTRQKKTAVKMNESASYYETWLAPVGQSHILKIHFSLIYYNADLAHKPILDYIINVKKSIVESIKLKLSQEQDKIKNETIKINPEIEEKTEHKNIVWDENQLESSEDIYDRIFNRDRRETIILKTPDENVTRVVHGYALNDLDETNYFNDALLYNPYDVINKNIKIVPPEPVNQNDPVIEELFKQQQKLAEQMQKTLNSHISFKNKIHLVK